MGHGAIPHIFASLFANVPSGSYYGAIEVSFIEDAEFWIEHDVAGKGQFLAPRTRYPNPTFPEDFGKENQAKKGQKYTIGNLPLGEYDLKVRTQHGTVLSKHIKLAPDQPVYKPTYEYTVVPDGYAVPGGLEISMDVSGSHHNLVRIPFEWKLFGVTINRYMKLSEVERQLTKKLLLKGTRLLDQLGDLTVEASDLFNDTHRDLSLGEPITSDVIPTITDL